MYYNEDEKAVYIGSLISKEIQGFALEKEEKRFLCSWIEESKENEETYKRCYDSTPQQEVYARLEAIDTIAALRLVKSQIKIHRNKNNNQKIRTFRILKYSAVAAVLLVFGVLVYTTKFNQKIIEDTIIALDYEPAKYKASVVLSDGRTFDLKNNDTLIINPYGIQDGQGNSLGENLQATYATVVTPRGGLYNITLPDGTHVRLNAESSLEYPIRWQKDKREVTLKGEGFFEVVHQQEQPFIVHTLGQSVEVLGTHFNVCAYSADTITKTTLLEGSVQVIANKGGQNLKLQPGEQSVLIGQSIAKHNVNVTQELAWLYGKFNFDGKNIYQVIDELSRWYDVDISYEGEMPNVEFFGGAYRDVKISTILNILKTYGVDSKEVSSGSFVLSYKADEKGGSM